MSSKTVIGFIILLVASSVLGYFSLALLGSTESEVSSLVPENMQSGYNITTTTITTSMTISSYLPYLFVLGAFAAAILMLAIPALRR